MNTTIPEDWTPIDKKALDFACNTVDWLVHSWSNADEYCIRARNPWDKEIIFAIVERDGYIHGHPDYF